MRIIGVITVEKKRDRHHKMRIGLKSIVAWNVIVKTRYEMK